MFNKNKDENGSENEDQNIEQKPKQEQGESFNENNPPLTTAERRKLRHQQTKK